MAGEVRQVSFSPERLADGKSLLTATKWLAEGKGRLADAR
jgi:hypothetical protein